MKKILVLAATLAVSGGAMAEKYKVYTSQDGDKILVTEGCGVLFIIDKDTIPPVSYVENGRVISTAYMGEWLNGEATVITVEGNIKGNIDVAKQGYTPAPKPNRVLDCYHGRSEFQ